MDVSACGVTNDGHLWIYDPTQFKLIKISDTGVSVLETSNVNDFGMVNVKITDIREKGNYVILCDRSKGFYFLTIWVSIYFLLRQKIYNHFSLMVEVYIITLLQVLKVIL